MSFRFFRALVAAAAIVPLGVSSASADPVEDFYHGKTISIIIPMAGGSASAFGRVAAEMLGRHIPGKPTVISQEMVGAGGIRAAMYIYNIAPKDGTAILIPTDSIGISQFVQPDQAKYDTTKFTWLGTFNQTRSVIVVRADTGAKSIFDLRDKPIFMTSSGSGSLTDFYPRVTNGLLGTKMKTVKGFSGSPDQFLAVVRGEMQGFTPAWDFWRRSRGAYPAADFVPLLQFGGEDRIKELPEVPNLLDLVSKPEDKQLVRFVTSLGPIGRGMTLPPGVPAERVAALRRAFQEMVNDPAFQKRAEQTVLELNPMKGEDIQDYVKEAMNIPESVVARAQAMIEGSQ